jgi:hypothetical protein
MLEDTEKQKIRLSQINLVCRVDDINAHASDLPNPRRAIPEKKGKKILLALSQFIVFENPTPNPEPPLFFFS